MVNVTCPPSGDTIIGSVLNQDIEMKKILPDGLNFYQPGASQMSRAGSEFCNNKENSIDGSVLTGKLYYRHQHFESY